MKLVVVKPLCGFWDAPETPTHRHAPATIRAPHRNAERGTVVGAIDI